jgi:hypothetical protein
MKRSMMVIALGISLSTLTAAIVACGECTDPKHKKTKNVSTIVGCGQEGCSGDHGDNRTR